MNKLSNIFNTYLYVIGCKDKNYYKIGHSRNPEKRLKAIQTSCPFNLNLICKKKSADARQKESKLHLWLWELRKQGEWFVLSPQILEKLIYKVKLSTI